MPLCGQNLELSLLSRYDHNLPNGGEVEIVAPYDSASQRLFVNLERDRVTIIDLSNPSTPDSIGSIDLTPYGTLALNVAVKNSLVAIAVQGTTKQDSGSVVFFDSDGNYINDITVGPAPGMLSFTPNGSYVVVANEGVPSDDYTNDPEGSISIIDLLNGAVSPVVSHVGFSDFNQGASKDSLFPPSVHIYGPGATRAQDLEPEFVAISSDGQKAYVSLQENNAVMVLDIAMGAIDTIFFLGYKDHSLAGNELDASDQDNGVNIASWPVLGMFQPDGIAGFSTGGVDYFLTANEGAARSYTGFDEEDRVSNLILDPGNFSNIGSLQAAASIGRLKVSNAFGDTDKDGNMDSLFCYGARSFSIWSASTGDLVYDSGDDLEQKTAFLAPAIFNSSGTVSTFDNRSDNKGPEPEDVVVGNVNGRNYAFIGLEQVGGNIVYDITDPSFPEFITYEPAAAGDISPEASVFISAQEAPLGQALLVVSYEISSTLAIYALSTSNSVTTNQSANLDIFPNPTTGVVAVDGKVSKLEAYDLYGTRIQSSSRNVLDISDASSGIYILKATDEWGSISSHKIIKE